MTLEDAGYDAGYDAGEKTGPRSGQSFVDWAMEREKIDREERIMTGLVAFMANRRE